MKKAIFSKLFFHIITGLSLFFTPTLFAAGNQTELFQTAIELYRQKEYQRAIDAFTKVIDIAPDHLESFRIRGAIYMKLNKHDLAVRDFEKAVLIDPGKEGVHSDLGTAWYYAENYHKALEYYDIEIEQGHENHLVYFNRALCLEQMGQVDKALEDLSKSLSLKSDFYWGHCFKGNLLALKKDYVNAAKAYEKAIAIDKKDPYAPEKLEKIKDHLDLGQKTADTTQKWTIQSGAFLMRENAAKLADRLNKKSINTAIIELEDKQGRLWHLVRSGTYPDRQSALDQIHRFKQMGLTPVIRPAKDW